jgi:hypothetical protein
MKNHPTGTGALRPYIIRKEKEAEFQGKTELVK